MSGEKISINEHGKWRQFFATLIINISALSYGLTIGWSSPIAPLLQTAQTPVGKVPMSDEQIAWMNGALCLGALCFLPICGFLTERFGRKIAGCLIAVPSTACWLLISFATNFWCLLAARIFAGIAGSLALIVLPLYVSEISGDSVRGQNGSILVFAVNIGIVVAYVLGATLPYQVFGLCAFATPILFLFGFCFMPETPIYLMRKGRIDEATRSLLWLKNNDKTTVDHELSRLSALAKENTANNNKSVGFRDLFRDRGTFKGLMIAMALLGGQQFAGISAVVTYAAKIFKMSGSSLDANTASILIGLIQVFGSWLSTVMMERAGRRSLILISCGGMAICHSILGTFLLIQTLGYEVKSFSWIPEVSVSFYAITYCLGMGPAPFVVASEVFAADIAGFANSIAMTFMWIIAFLSMKCFPAVIDALGMDGSFYLLATFCVCTFFFTYFFIPETKGRSIESILDELNGVTKGGRDGEYRRTSVELIGEIPRSPV